MKRVITLLMAAVMLIGTAGLASAVEFKASGHMHIIMGVQDNGSINSTAASFDKDVKEDNFYAATRFRPKLTMTAEGVTAVFEAQQHQFLWGDNERTGTSNMKADVRVRNAYIDFKIPSTIVSLKMGFQQLSLPSIWGHPIFDTRVGGVVATIPVNDQIAIAAFYARPQHNNDASTLPDRNKNSVDMYGLLLPLDFGMVKATPYFVYAKVGADSGALGTTPTVNADYMVGGANVEVAATDALSIKVDGIFTSISSDTDTVANKNIDDIGTGYHFALAVDYEMPFGTPGVFGWYSSGSDDDGKDRFYSPGYTDGFGPTTLGFEGYNTFWNGAWVGTTGMATMGVGLQVADMSFIDSLKHTVRVAYIKGTNDMKNNADAGYESWSKDDSFIEINLDSTWAIYENLAAVVEMGYLINDIDKGGELGSEYGDDNAWRGQVTFRFTF